jgi:hypothetical protein
MKTTITVTGRTYDFRDWLKSEGFVFCRAEKSWSMKCVEVDGVLSGPHFTGSTKAGYEHRVGCYTKVRCYVTWSDHD